MANTILKIIGAIMWFFAGILLTVKAGYMITIISENLYSPLAKAIFWAGFIIMWILAVIAVPVYGIMGSFKED